MSIERLIENLMDPKEHGNIQAMMGCAAFRKKKEPEPASDVPVVVYEGDLSSQQNAMHARINNESGTTSDN